MAEAVIRWLKNLVQEENNSMTFEDIYREHSGKILNLSYRMSGREEIARDLTQEIFIKVYENMETFRGESQEYTWIYRIAINHILNYLKKSQQQRWLNLMDKPLSDVLTEEKIEPTFWGSSGPSSPDRKLEKSEREKIIWSIVQSLPPKYRLPFVLHRYEDMSYKEIAETMGLSLSALEARIHRAKKMMIEKLRPWVEYL
jgi:RNA polymerase sigma-70 factor (ECF subfamily)